MPLRLRTSYAALILCFGAIASPSVLAEGLGEIQVSSHLGEHFRAEIPFVGGALPRGENCLRLVADPNAAESGLPSLRDAVVTLNAARTLLTISSNSQVSEPALRVSVGVGCSNYLTRHYTVLLSPAPTVSLPRREPAATGPAARSDSDRVDRPVAPVRRAGRRLQEDESVAELSRRRFPGRPLLQQRFEQQMIALNPHWLSADTLDLPPPAGVDVAYPQPVVATPTPPRDTAEASPPPKVAAKAKKAEAAQYRLVISPPAEADLSKAPPEVIEREIGERLGGVDKEIVDMRRELEELRAAYPNPPAALRTLFVEMETRLARVELAATRIRLTNLAKNSTAAEAPPTVASAGAIAAPVEAAPAAATSATPAAPVIPAASTAPTAAPVVAAAPPAKPTAAQELVQAGQSNAWLGLGFLALFGAGFGVFLVRRSSQRGAAQALDTLSGEEDNTWPVRKPAVLTPPPPEPEEESPQPAAHIRDLELPVHEQLSPVREALYLADMFRTYGRTPLAIETLKDFIATHPDKTLLPSLALMRIYRGVEDRAAFDQLALRLASEFNAEPVGWDADIREVLAPKPSGATLESVANHIRNFPHVYSKIAAGWPSPQTLDYLYGLLQDSRKGQRTGFSLQVIHEISALIELLELILLRQASERAAAVT